MRHPHEEGQTYVSSIPVTSTAAYLAAAWKFYAKNGEKIEAIKLYRVLYNCDLKAAKDGVEGYMLSSVFSDAKSKFDDNAVFLKSVCASMTAKSVSNYDAKRRVVRWVEETLDEAFPS